MSSRNRIRGAIASLYALAVVVSIFTGGLVWVAVVGAVVTSIAYRALAGPPAEGGRNRQRNRNRNRDRAS